MNRKLLTLQLAGCGLLSIVLLMEWGYGQFAYHQMQATLAQTSQSDYQSDALPELEMPKQSADHFSAVVERPLFIEGRKPIVETAKSENVANTDNGQIDDWLLIGIYNRDKQTGPLALFRKQNEAKKYLKLGDGQAIAGWQLQQIQPDRVILRQGEQQKTVMLRKPRPQTKGPVPRIKPAVPPAIPAQPAQPQETPAENSNDDSE